MTEFHKQLALKLEAQSLSQADVVEALAREPILQEREQRMIHYGFHASNGSVRTVLVNECVRMRDELAKQRGQCYCQPQFPNAREGENPLDLNVKDLPRRGSQHDHFLVTLVVECARLRDELAVHRHRCYCQPIVIATPEGEIRHFKRKPRDTGASPDSPSS